MTEKNKEDILKKAIEKAVKNGYKCEDNIDSKRHMKSLSMFWNGYRIIFSHDFAKAFWKGVYPRWQYHLQMMVLEKDPIKYLEKFV